jgi:hypothetical protein
MSSDFGARSVAVVGLRVTVQDARQRADALTVAAWCRSCAGVYQTGRFASGALGAEALLERVEASGFSCEPRPRLGVRSRKGDRAERLRLPLADRVVAVKRLDRVVHRFVGDAQVMAFVHLARAPAHDPLDHPRSDAALVHDSGDRAPEGVAG